MFRLKPIVEAEYGADVREKMFGNISTIGDDNESIKKWFNHFTESMDELGNKEFFTKMFAKRCPCSYPGAENDIKKP